MAKSGIEWTEVTWNPVTGCNKISPGCKCCYAEKMANRCKWMGLKKYVNGFKLTLHPEVLEDPYKWKKPKVVFVNSMSDMFHEGVPERFIRRAFKVMNATSWHTYQVLTKRSDRLLDLNDGLIWGKNIWMGVSVENQDYTWRIDHLRQTDAKVKFLSLEPLLGPLPNLSLDGIDWVITGGESGPGCRQMNLDWARDIRDQCQNAGVKFFLKQLGGFPDKRGGKQALLDGKLWHEMPER
jgi:protein gp37